MASREDPFGLGEDSGRTRIRPAAAASPPRGPRDGARVPLQPREHPNPLIGAFGALLAFAPELESPTAPSDPETLRTRLLDGLISARDAAVARGVPLAKADAGAWAVAALLDDLALHTPWGDNSAWPRQTLVSTLYGDVDAGARFFDRLEELEAHPNRDPEMLELFYFCLSLGFRGRYRVPGRAGARSLAAVRTSAARLLRDPEAAQAPLSPNWQGVVAADEPRRFAVPLWVLFAAAAVAAAAIYFALSLRLAGQSEQLAVLARSLPPAERAEIYRPPRDTTKPPAPPAEPSDFTLVPSFEAAAPEGLRPAMKGSETVSLATLVIQWTDPEVFRSSQADLTEGFEPLIAVGRPGDRREPGRHRQRHRRRPHRQHPGRRRQPLPRQPGPERGARRHHRPHPRRQRRPARPRALRRPRRDRAGRQQQDQGRPRAQPPRRDPDREEALRWRCCASSGPSSPPAGSGA